MPLRKAGSLPMTYPERTTWSMTERKREEEVTEKELYCPLVDGVEQGVWIIDADHRTISVSEKIAKMLGHNVDEMVGKQLFDFVREEWRVIAENYAERWRQGIREQHGLKFRCKDGSELWVAMTVNPIFGTEGKYSGALAIVTEVSEHEQTEKMLLNVKEELEKQIQVQIADLSRASKALKAEIAQRERVQKLLAKFNEALQAEITEHERARKALRKFKAICDRADYGAAISKPDGNLIYVNESFADMHGYEVEELVGRHLSILHTEEQMELLEGLIDQLMRTGVQSAEEVWHKRKDGTVFPIVWAGATISDDEGIVQFLSTTAIDITERKLAEGELHLQAAIISNMLEGVVLTRASDAVIVYTNPKFEEMFGYGSGELIGRNILELNAPTDKSPEEVARDIQRSLKKTGEWRGEVYNIKKDGTPFWCHASVSTFNHHDYGEVWVAAHIDITEHKQAEELFRTLAESSPTGVYIIQGGKFQYVNPRLQQLTGYSANELAGDDYLKFVIPEDRDTVRKNARKMLKGERSSPYEYRYFDKDGQVKWAMERVVSFKYQEKRATLGYAMDITERKQVEEALKREKEYTQGILNTIQTIVLTLDKEGRILYFNQYMEEISGYTVEEVRGKDWLETFLPARDRKRIRKLFITAASGIKTRGNINTILTKDGQELLIEWYDTTLKDEDGNIIGVLATGQDITERKQAEELFRTLAESAPTGVYIIQDGRFQYFNPRFQELSGYSADELLSNDYLSFVAPEDRDMVKRNAMKMLKGEHSSPYEYRYISKGGQYKWVMETVVSFQYLGRQATLGYAMDITERKQMEEQLGESEERYRDLADLLPQIVFETDMQGNFTFANRNALRSFGYSENDLRRGLNLFQMIVPKERTRAKRRVQQVLSGEEVGPSEYTARRKDGSKFPILVHTSPVVHENQVVGLRGIGVDITKQRRVSDNMQFYITEVAKAQEEERRRIARELHDDTAQALATLSLEIQGILMGEKQLNDETIQRLEQLRLKTDSILEGVRRFSQQLRPEVLDQLGLIPALESLTEGLNRDGNISARVEVVGSERRLSAESELVLFRIAQEAVRNVTRHSEAKQAVVRLKFTARKVKLSIKDNGKGFEVPEVLADFALRGKLGLVGIAEWARLIGGNLSVKSQPGKGTTLSVEIVE